MSEEQVRALRKRLRQLAQEQAAGNTDVILQRLGRERLLYRIAESTYGDRFLLKGAMLFALWYDVPHRPTKDIDLLGFGSADLVELQQMFQSICSVPGHDGLEFLADSVVAVATRFDAYYPGVQVRLQACLGSSRIPLKVDVGYGDSVTPEPEFSDYPQLLPELPPIRLRTYPVYTVIAEKLHAITLLGMANSRMKDYFDLLVILERETLDPGLMRQAVQQTFSARRSPLPSEIPPGLTGAFGDDLEKQGDWHRFLSANALPERDLTAVVGFIREQVASVLLEI